MITHRIIYTSLVARGVRYSDAERISAEAAVRNERVGVTGLLLYTPSHFVQVLEGKAETLEHLLARIQRDQRHSQLRVIDRRDVDVSEFAGWAMQAHVSAAKSAEIVGLNTDRTLTLLRHARDEHRAEVASLSPRAPTSG